MEKVVLGHMDKQIVKNELLRTCREKYNFQIERIQKNEQSTDKNVYDIYCNKDRYIMKIYNNIEHTKSMVNLHNKLRLSRINVPKIITTKENENYTQILKEKYIVVYSFIEGKPIERNIQTGLIDKQTIISIAQMVKKIHKLTENRNEFNLPILPFINNSKRKSLLHFDLTKNNILKSHNGKINIIDFDDAKYGDSVCDIAILIANLFFSKTYGVDLEGMNEFINEYYSDNLELRKIEEPLIKKYALEWIKYTLDGHEFSASLTESFKVKYKLISDRL